MHFDKTKYKLYNPKNKIQNQQFIFEEEQQDKTYKFQEEFNSSDNEIMRDERDFQSSEENQPYPNQSLKHKPNQLDNQNIQKYSNDSLNDNSDLSNYNDQRKVDLKNIKLDRQERRNIRKKNMQEFIQLYQNKMKIKDIAQKLNISIGNTYYLCKLYQKKLQNKQQFKSDEDDSENLNKEQRPSNMLDRYLTGQETVQILADIQSGQYTILSLLAKLNKLAKTQNTQEGNIQIRCPRDRQNNQNGDEDKLNQQQQQARNYRKQLYLEQQRKIQQLKQQRTKCIDEIIKIKPQASVNQVHRIMKNQYNMTCTRTTVAKIMKIINFNNRGLLAMPLQSDHDRVIQQRLTFVRKIDQMKNQDIIFIDEVGFMVSLVDIFGLIPRIEIAYEASQGPDQESVSLLLAVCYEKIQSQILVQGELKLSHINAMLNELKELAIKGQPTKTIILQQSKYFTNQQVIDAIKSCGFDLLYMPSSFPQLNPIEEIFCRLRAKFSQRLPRTSFMMKELLDRELKKMCSDTNGRVKTSFIKMREFIKKVISQYPYQNKQ